MSTEFRSRHLAIIGASAIAITALLTETDLNSLEHILAALGAYAGVDLFIAKFKKKDND